MYEIESFKKIYSGWFSDPTPLQIFGLLFFFSLPLLIPYLYIRFFESRTALFARNRFIPFIRYRLHLERLIGLIDRVLKIRIFRNPRAKA